MIAYDNQISKLKKNTDYKVVWDKGVKKVSNNMILLYLVNKKDYSRIGISSVRNYGTAVERNKIIRRIKSILYLYNLPSLILSSSFVFFSCFKATSYGD